MKKPHIKVCWKVFIANICSYMGLFMADVWFFHVEKVEFTAIYGYLLFPIFSIACGRVSYQKTKQVILPNFLYFSLCLLFCLVFTSIGLMFANDIDSLMLSPSVRRAFETMPIIGLCTTISVVFSFFISVITSWVFREKRSVE